MMQYQYIVTMADGATCLLQYDYAVPYADPALRERLPDLKKQGSTLYGPACFRLVLALYQQKLSGSRGRIAEV